MSAFVWLLAGILVWILFPGSGKGNRSAQKGPFRIDRPHVIEPEDYECSVCHRRFRKNAMVCPYCGTKFGGRVTNEEEWCEEEDELEDWDEEDGL